MRHSWDFRIIGGALEGWQTARPDAKMEIKNGHEDYEMAKRLFESISKTFKEKIIDDIIVELRTK